MKNVIDSVKIISLLVFGIHFSLEVLACPSVSQDKLDMYLKNAVVKSDRGAIDKFINCGANLESRSGDSYTILHWAVAKANLETIKLIVERGADVKALEFNRRDVKHLASLRGDLPITQYVFTLEVEDKIDWYRKSAFHLAALHNHTQIYRELKERGVDIDAQDWKFQTVLHYAVLNEHFESVKLLLELGVDPYILDEEKAMAIDYAWDPKIRKIIKEYTRHRLPLNR
ncbi:MAG: ankyrin repeat domain-containing protein [Bacteriovoracaceae bacterium]